MSNKYRIKYHYCHLLIYYPLEVVLPNLATLRICVCDENGKLLGHRVIPVEGLRPGRLYFVFLNLTRIEPFGKK